MCETSILQHGFSTVHVRSEGGGAESATFSPRVFKRRVLWAALRALSLLRRTVCFFTTLERKKAASKGYSGSESSWSPCATGKGKSSSERVVATGAL